MKKVDKLLINETENISYSDLVALKRDYWKLLKENEFPRVPERLDAISMIDYLKRKDENSPQSIGPYGNITVFEAANRIASDLVIIAGVLQLINDGKESKESKITIHLGTKHVKDQGDFEINGKLGEAFNVAPSFFKAKLYQTKQKWKGKELTYILVNQEVSNDFFEFMQNEDKIILVKDWQKE